MKFLNDLLADIEPTENDLQGLSQLKPFTCPYCGCPTPEA